MHLTGRAKLVTTVVRYFLPLQGVKVKLSDLQSFLGETSEILTSTLVLVKKEHELEHKVTGLCVDNCNINFGGVKKRDNNNVYSPLKKEFHQGIVGVGCAAHTMYNCLQTAVDVLSIDIEILVVEILPHIHSACCTVGNLL
jgi:hypothetical protein